MVDFFRPFLFPITVCTIVGCVWAIGWNKSMEDKIAEAGEPAPIVKLADPLDDEMPTSLAPMRPTLPLGQLSASAHE